MIIPQKEFDAIFDPDHKKFIDSSALMNGWLGSRVKTPKPAIKMSVNSCLPEKVTHLSHDMACRGKATEQ